MRLLAVRTEPACFGTSFEQEAARSEDEWRTTIASNAWLVAGFRPLSVDARNPTDQVAGIAAAFWTDRQPDGAPQLGAMWVAPDYRGTGLAGRLVGALEQLARIRGERSIGLWVTPANEGAERFYQRLGYRHTGVRKPAPADPDILMRRMRRDLGVAPTRGCPQADRP